jgi:hypothetical protein
MALISKSTYHILLTQILGYGMITAWAGTHYGMDVPFDPWDIIDLLALWGLFISFGILWYKIDRQKDYRIRILHYLNFFIIFSSIILTIFWAQEFWVPIPLSLIIIYAVGLLVRHIAVKKEAIEPMSLKRVATWTGFLILCFFSTILQVTVFSPSDFWILLVPIGIYIFLALYYTPSE